MGDSSMCSRVIKADYIVPFSQSTPNVVVQGIVSAQTVNGVGNAPGGSNISLTTDNVPEGMYRLYYTDSRVDARIAGGGAVTALQYQDRWDATSGAFPPQPQKGYYWVISARGILNPGGVSVNVGDWVVFNGTSWDIMSINTDGILNASLVPGSTTSVALNYLYDCSLNVIRQTSGDIATSSVVNNVAQMSVSSVGGRTANDISTTVSRSHVHANVFALSNVAGVNTGDQTVNGVSSTPGSSNVSITSDQMPEGSTNRYYTDGRVDTRISYWKNTASGVAGLDADSRILVAQLPSAALRFAGIWDASLGYWPPTPVPGSFYVVTVAGVIDDGGFPVADSMVGDWLVYCNNGWSYSNHAIRAAGKIPNDSLVVPGANVREALEALHSEVVGSGFIAQLSGDVTTPTGDPTRAATVVQVGGASAANIATAVTNSHSHLNLAALGNVAGVNTGDQTVNGVTNAPGTTNIILTSDTVTEGSTNKYYTEAKVNANISAKAGQANGLATLDSLGTVPASQLPASITNSLIFIGPYAVPGTLENYPALPGGDKYYWIISVAGTLSGAGKPTLVANVADSLIYDGATWTIINRPARPASEIVNDSSVTGSTVKDALNTLLPMVTAAVTEVTGDVVVLPGGGSVASTVETVYGKTKVQIGAAVDSAHTHTNAADVAAVSGVNTGDQTVNLVAVTEGTHNVDLNTDDIPEGTTNKYYNTSFVASYVSSQKNTGSGVAGLDTNARLSTSQIPSSLLGSLKYQGTRLISEGFPSAPAAGNYWVITGVEGEIDPGLRLVAGDWLVYNGTSWDINNATARPSRLITNDSTVTGSTVTNALETLKTAAAAGITQLTGDVAVGIGGGSQVSTVNTVGGKTKAAVADAVNKAHSHTNTTALNAVAGVNTGDQTVNNVASTNGTSNISLTTTQIPESGQSLYFTDARVDAYVTVISGVPNRLATLDGTGKLNNVQIPDTVKNPVQYRGVWNVEDAAGAFPSETLVKGNYWVISVAGTLAGGYVVKIGDWIVYNGATWDVIQAAARVASDITNDTNVPAGAATVGAAISALNTQSSAGITQLTGDVTAPAGTGSRASTVAYVGGVSAANISNAVTMAVHSNRTAVDAVSGVNTGDQTVNGKTGSSIVLNTDDVAEGATNLYYTNARADARVNTKFSTFRGAPNGVASLDAAAKVPLSQIPDSIVAGGLTYAGSWDASAGTYPPTPTIHNFWIISVIGTLGGTHLMKVGDWLIYQGPDPLIPANWDYINYGATVASGVEDDSTLSQGTVKNALEYTYGVADAAISQLTGDVIAPVGTGSRAATVVSVGGASAANVATAVTLANHSNRTALDSVTGVNTGDQSVNGKTGTAIVLQTDDIAEGPTKKFHNDAMVDAHLATMTAPINTTSTVTAASMTCGSMQVTNPVGVGLAVTGEASAKQARITDAPSILSHSVRLNEWRYESPGFKVDTTGWYLVNTAPMFQNSDSLILNIKSPSNTELEYSWANNLSRSLLTNYVAGSSPRVVVNANPNATVAWKDTDFEGTTYTTNLTGPTSFVFGVTNTGDARYLTDVMCHIGGTAGPINAAIDIWIDSVNTGVHVWSGNSMLAQYTGTPNPIITRGPNGFVAKLGRGKTIYMTVSTNENMTIVTRPVPATNAVFILNAVDQGINLLVGTVNASLTYYGPTFYVYALANSLIQVSRSTNPVTSISYLSPAAHNYSPVNNYVTTSLYDSNDDTGENIPILGFSVADIDAWYRIILRNTTGYSSNQGAQYKIISPQINVLEFSQNGLEPTSKHTNYSAVTSPRILVYPHVDSTVRMGPATDGIYEPAYTGVGRTVTEWTVPAGSSVWQVYQNITGLKMYLTQFKAAYGLDITYNPSIANITTTLYRGIGNTGTIAWQQTVAADNYFGPIQNYMLMDMPNTPVSWNPNEFMTITITCATAVTKVAAVNVAGTIASTDNAVDVYDGNLSTRHIPGTRQALGVFYASSAVLTHVQYLKAPRTTTLIVLRSDPDVIDIANVNSGTPYPLGNYPGEILYDSSTDHEALVDTRHYITTLHDVSVGGNLRVLSTEQATTVGDGSGYFAGGLSADGDFRAHTIYAQGPGASPPTPLTNLLVQAWDTKDGFIQSNVQNTSSAPGASSDLVATADNGDDNTGYIDVGINGSTYDVPGWTINGANDGYVVTAGGGLALGVKGTPNHKVTFFTEDTLIENERMSISSSQVLVETTTPSTSTTTGALVVQAPGAGLGVNGKINAVDISATSAITGSSGAFSSTLSATTSVTSNTFVSPDTTAGVKLSVAGTDQATSTLNGCATFKGGISTGASSVFGGRIVNQSGGINATTVSDGAIQTDGGLSVTQKAVIGAGVKVLTGGLEVVAGNVNITNKTFTALPTKTWVVSFTGAVNPINYSFTLYKIGNMVFCTIPDMAFTTSGSAGPINGTIAAGMGANWIPASIVVDVAGVTTTGNITTESSYATSRINVNSANNRITFYHGIGNFNIASGSKSPIRPQTLTWLAANNLE